MADDPRTRLDEAVALAVAEGVHGRHLALGERWLREGRVGVDVDNADVQRLTKYLAHCVSWETERQRRGVGAANPFAHDMAALEAELEHCFAPRSVGGSSADASPSVAVPPLRLQMPDAGTDAPAAASPRAPAAVAAWAASGGGTPTATPRETDRLVDGHTTQRSVNIPLDYKPLPRVAADGGDDEDDFAAAGADPGWSVCGCLGDPEWRKLWKLAWPGGLSELFLSSGGLISSACIGQFSGTDALAGASLGLAFMSLTRIFPLSTSVCLNMLCSQAVGAGNKPLVGVWLQIAILVYTLLMVPVFVAWWFATADVLRALGQNGVIPELGETFARYSIPGFYFNGVAFAVEQYLVTIDVVYPSMVCAGVFTFAGLGLAILFMNGAGSWEGLGFRGAPVGQSIASFLQLVALVAYCVYRGHFTGYWTGISAKEILKPARLKEYFKQCLPTALGLVAEEGQAQVLTVFCMHLGTASIDAWTCLANLWYLAYSSGMGFCRATNIRVAYHLGRDQLPLVKRVVRFSCMGVVFASVTTGFTLWLLRRQVAAIFTSDHDVIDKMADNMVYICASLPTMLLGTVISYVLEAQGRPGASAGSFMVGTWLINVPLAALLIYHFDLGLAGVYISIVTGYTVSCGIIWVCYTRSDWPKYVEDARRRCEMEKAEADEAEEVEGARSASEATSLLRR